MNLFSKQNELLKPELQKLLYRSYHKIFYEPNLINSPFAQDPSLKFFFSQGYILELFQKLINTRMRDKDQTKRRNTQSFYTD